MGLLNDIKNSKIKPQKLKSRTGQPFEIELKHAANRLANCIQYAIDDAIYNAYNPKSYVRTYGLYDSLYVEDITQIQVVGKRITIKMLFDDGIYHKSLFGSEKVNVLWLLNYGYEVEEDVWFKDIPYFGYREGAYFIEKGIEEFKKTDKLGFTVEIVKPDRYY